MAHIVIPKTTRSLWLVSSLALIMVLWLAPAPAQAGDDECGPEIKKKDVQVYEVDARHPGSKLQELQASKGETWDVVLEDEVRSDSSPVRKAKIEAARRGCPIVIVGEVRREDTKTTVSVGGGFGGAPSARRGWTKVAKVLYADLAPVQNGPEAVAAKTP